MTKSLARTPTRPLPSAPDPHGPERVRPICANPLRESGGPWTAASSALPEFRFSGRLTPRGLELLLAALRLTVRRRGYVLIRDAGFGRTALRALLAAIADPRRPVDAELLDRLSVRGRAPSLPVPARVPALPLHRDAVLVGAPGELIGFSALATDPAFDAGALELVDSVTALAEFPADLLHVLASRAFEYRLRDCSPFPNVPAEWFSRPTFVRAATGRALNIVLAPAPRPGAAAPWETRLRGLGPRASAQVLARVDDHLRASSTFRSHIWSTADAVVVDNSRVLHGIAAVPAAARHHIIRESL